MFRLFLHRGKEGIDNLTHKLRLLGAVALSEIAHGILDAPLPRQDLNGLGKLLRGEI